MRKTIETRSFELSVYINGDEKASKLALVLPGRMDTKDYIHMTSHVDFLASLGFLAVSFDPPGTWESKSDPIDYTMTNYIKAANELIEYFGNLPTLVYGTSRGGSIAMFVGMQNPNVTGFIAAMSWYGYSTDIRDNFPVPEWEAKGYKISMRDKPPGDKQGLEQTEHKFYYEFAKDAIKYDARPLLRECEKPKLLIGALRDEAVPIDIVREGFEMASEPKMYAEIDSDHNYRYHPELIDQINSYIKNFIDKYIL